MSSPPTLAIPTFVSGAKDDVAAIDVYTQTRVTSYGQTSEVPTINSFQDIASSSLPSSVASQRGSKSMLGDLSSVLSLSTLTSALTGSSALTSRLGSSSPIGNIISSALSKLSPNISSNILGGLGSPSKMGINVGGINGIGGITSLISGGNLPNVKALSSLMNSVSGNSGLTSIIDHGASAGALSGVIRSASSSGIPNSFGALMGGNTDSRLVQSVASACLPSLLGNGDLGSMKSLTGMVPAGFVNMASPNAISTLSKNYSNPLGFSSSSQSQSTYSDFTSTASAIDPSWNTSIRQTPTGIESVYDITSIQGASPDLSSILTSGAMSSSDPAEKMYCLAPVYAPTTVNDQLSSQFPSTVITQSTTSSSGATDPRSSTTTFPPTQSEEVFAPRDPNVVSRVTTSEPQSDGETFVTTVTTTYKDGTTSATKTITNDSGEVVGVIPSNNPTPQPAPPVVVPAVPPPVTIEGAVLTSVGEIFSTTYGIMSTVTTTRTNFSDGSSIKVRETVLPANPNPPNKPGELPNPYGRVITITTTIDPMSNVSTTTDERVGTVDAPITS